MKNYNGSQPSSSLPEHHSSLKSPQNSQLRSVLKNPFTPEENFTVQDLKQEYNRALGYIDKLKSDQTYLKSTLKLNPETAYEEENFSSPKSFHSQNNKKKSSRDNERRLMDLEEENEELKGQLETAMARVAKLHRENKSLQERSVNQDSQAVNKELFNEVRAFQQEVKVLTARIQELEEDNIKLLKQRERVQQARAPQKPSQSLLRYINYVFKLIGSTPRSSSSRSCFEERFPKNINVNEILESGDFEQVLLKSFKYITDLLINLNSLPTEESIPKIAEITIDANSQYIERLGSRMVSPKSVKGETESFYRKRQPSQDGKDFEMSVEENVSGLKSPKSSRKYFEGGQMRNTVQKMGVSEENSGFKKLHSRHCSSTIGFSVRQDETADDGEMLSLRKKVTSDWESRQGNNQGLTSRNEEESTILQRRKTMDLKNVEKEIEKEVGKEMKTSRNYGKDREVKEYRSVRAEKEAIEEQYRSKYAKSKVAKQEKEDVKVKREEQEGERRNVKAYTRDQEAAQDSDREEQARYKSKGMVSPQEYRSGLVSRDQEIMEELHESGETHEENGEGKDKQEMWDRKREQLVRLSRKSSSNQNGVDSEYRGKDYSTFRVSFGRTESKAMKSLSPESKAFAGIMDVPRKKRVDQIGTKFDVITGGEGKPVTPSSVKSGNGKTIKFMLDEGSSKGLVSQRSKEIGKSFSMEKSGIEEAATPKKR